jgi:glycine cleavage system regulatory protein
MAASPSTQDGVRNFVAEPCPIPLPTFSAQPAPDGIDRTSPDHRAAGEEPNFGFAAIWLEPDHRKMTISFIGIDRTTVMAHVAERLMDRRINIEWGHSARIEEVTGAFLKIAGEPTEMQQLYEEITQDKMQSPREEEHSITGSIHELEVIGPDRSGMLYDIARSLGNSIDIIHLVIKTKETSEGRKGIVYARIVASEQALAAFKDNLRTIPDVHRWQWRCQLWDRRTSPSRRPGIEMAHLN